MSNRYKTKAGRYYRDLLKSEIKNINIPEPPSLEDGKIMIDNIKPEFYKSISSVSYRENFL